MTKSELQRAFVQKMQELDLTPEERSELVKVWFQVLIGASYDSETDSWDFPEVDGSEEVMSTLQELRLD